MKRVVGNLDVISSFVFILLALLTCYLSKRLSLWTPEGPSDGFFPFLGGLALAFFGLCLLVQRGILPEEKVEWTADALANLERLDANDMQELNEVLVFGPKVRR